LSKARKQLIGQLAMSQENHEDLMLAIGKSMLVFNKVESLEDIYRKITEISPTQLMDVANLVLEPKNLSGLIYQ
jgi:predicted Zn-dependent peptidase